ncbi:hypothetical protein GGR55DRAFT_373742 [Xylaria sp. FL0064]|nr:hypothetical protein GGR55DRAFT_373742 [Xylaria sp. FL0064]
MHRMRLAYASWTYLAHRTSAGTYCFILAHFENIAASTGLNAKGGCMISCTAVAAQFRVNKVGLFGVSFQLLGLGGAALEVVVGRISFAASSWRRWRHP